jgi:RNA polymerase sigma-70 factor (ECF subfamily)
MALPFSDIDQFEAARPRLEAIAYRMLGSASEAQDVVQESYLRWQAADTARIDVPQAWLTKVLTNICLNQLTSARARRETYVGQWLPEPLLEGDPMLGPEETAEQRESVSYAVMVLLERLSPRERAVYVLREAFAYSHREIAEILDLSVDVSQQTYHRAQKHLAQGRARGPLGGPVGEGASSAVPGEEGAGIDASAARRVVEEFLAAATSGRIEPLIELLTSDAVAVGDGGGKVPARASAWEGARAVAKFLRGMFKPAKAKRDLVGGSPDLYAIRANGGPALVAVVDGRVFGIMCLERTPEGIVAIRSQVNPDKLQRATQRWAAGGFGSPVLAAAL